MKIRVAILEKDQNYQNRLLVALRERYFDKIEVFPCNTPADVLGVIETHEIKVFAVNQMIDIDLSAIPEECAVVCLTEFRTDEVIKGHINVCKYQKVSDICRQLIQIGKDYDKLLEKKREEEFKALQEKRERERREEEERLRREKEEEEERQRLEQERLERERKEEEERIAAAKAREEEERQRIEEERRAEEEKIKARRSTPEIYVFISAESGDGSSTISTASVLSNMVKGYNILYLDFKQFSNMQRFFDIEGLEIGFSEVLYKAEKGELTTEELEKSIIRDDRSGRNYINNIDCTFELAMLGPEGFLNIYKDIGELVKYDIIVINMDSILSQMNYSVFRDAKKIIFVGSGLSDSNNHIIKTVDAIRKYDAIYSTDVVKKVNILYNKYVNKNCTTLNLDDVEVIGGIPVIKEKTETRIMESIMKMSVLRQIIE